jgi:AbiV family abortive infection protein
MGTSEDNYWAAINKEDLLFEKEPNGLPAKLNTRTLRRLLDSCLSNANQLIKSSEVLFNRKMYSISNFLSILAIEELGKRQILGGYIWSANDDKKRREFWKSFRSHKEKIYWALRPVTIFDMATEGRDKKQDYISLWEQTHEELINDAQVINDWKQLSIYVNVIEGQIYNQNKLTKRKTVKKMLQNAQFLFEYHRDMETTEKILKNYKHLREKRKKGESLADFLGREYFQKKK